jgi:hypothetical protein
MATPDRKDAQPEARQRTNEEAARHLEELLDEALADSFPASDPVSFVTSQMEEDWEEKPAAARDGKR